MNLPTGSGSGVQVSGTAAFNLVLAVIIGIAGYLTIDKLTVIEKTFTNVAHDLIRTNEKLTAIDSLAKANQIINDLQGEVLNDHELRIRQREQVNQRTYPTP